MRRLNLAIAALLSAALLLTPAAAHSHEAPSISPWAQEEVAQARSLGLLDIAADYRLPISRGQFCTVALEFVAIQSHCDSRSLGHMSILYLTDRDGNAEFNELFFPDAGRNEAVAHRLGIVQGRGDGNFDPEGSITRQEAATMLLRAYAVFGGTLTKGDIQVAFTDQEEMADWAKESVATLASWGIMNGLEDGSFDPLGNYSVEQCLATFLRLYEQAPISVKHGNAQPLFDYEQCAEYLQSRYLVEDGSIGYIEGLRVDGNKATFFYLHYAGVPHAVSDHYLLYQEGGLRQLDPGICSSPFGFACPLEEVHFSEDGQTLYFTSLLDMDTIVGYPEADTIWHQAGRYHTTMDVDTCQYELEWEELPAVQEEPLPDTQGEVPLDTQE